jgi:hypothetical protein
MISADSFHIVFKVVNRSAEVVIIVPAVLGATAIVFHSLFQATFNVFHIIKIKYKFYVDTYIIYKKATLSNIIKA